MTLEGIRLLAPTSAHTQWRCEMLWSDGSTSIRWLNDSRTGHPTTGHQALGRAAEIAREHGLVLLSVTTEHGEVYCG